MDCNGQCGAPAHLTVHAQLCACGEWTEDGPWDNSPGHGAHTYATDTVCGLEATGPDLVPASYIAWPAGTHLVRCQACWDGAAPDGPWPLFPAHRNVANPAGLGLC